MEQQKKANKEASQRQRDKQKGMTPEGMTGKGMTEEWYPNKRTDNQGQPIIPVKLSDGQQWYPRNPEGLASNIIEDIERAGKIHGDTEARMSRALKYKEWVDNGKPQSKSIRLDNGSYIHINKLVDPHWRSLLTYLVKEMRYPDGLRVGIQGPTITEVKELLQVTA